MGRKTKARLRSPLSGQPQTQIDIQVHDHMDSLSDHGRTTSFNIPAAHRQSVRWDHHNALSLLQPITSFSPMQGHGGDAAIAGGLSTSLNHGIVRNSTVIEILIRLLCQEREAEPKRREMLFRALCTVIEQCNTSFYSPLHAYPQLQDFQTNLLKTFEMLFKKAQNEIPSNATSLAVPSLHLPASLLSQSTFPSVYRVDDRYGLEFIEVEVLGRGGFGVVVKAQNKLDGCFYAIKIITPDQGDGSDNTSLLREVQALARLDHPHIVRYHSTWAQFYVLPPHLNYNDQFTEKLERRLRRPTSAITKSKVSSVSGLPSVRIRELLSSAEGKESNEETSSKVSFQEENISDSKISNTITGPQACDVVCEESGEMNCNVSGLEMMTNKGESIHSESFQKSLEFVNGRKVSNVSFNQPVANNSFNFKFRSKGNLHTKSSSDESVIFLESSHKNSDSKSKTSSVSQSKKSNSLSFEFCLDSSSEKDAVAAWNHSKCSSSSSYEACGKHIIPYHPLANRVQQLQRHSSIPQMTLFIQMGLCGESLKDWLLRRSEIHTPGFEGKHSEDRSKCLGLFKQVLLAIQYIHSQNIIHRDIKPANIFFTLDGSHIQLGDFGLARLLPDVVNSGNGEKDFNLDLTPISEHAPNTHGVGTPIYAAPELKIGQYNAKSDMHSVGIILLELFQLFQTGSERIHVIDSLKSKRHLDQDLIISSPDIAPWILKLTDPEPGKRPSASEVLDSSLFKIPSFKKGPPPMNRTQHVDTRASSSIIVERSEAKQSFYSSVKLEDHEKGLLKEKSEDWERNIENIKLKEENLKLREMVAKLQEQIEQKNSFEANIKLSQNG